MAEGITDTVNITLKDDGVASDIIKDDGIYSGNFYQFSDKGRYSIKVLANGNNGKAAVSKGHMLGVGKMDDDNYQILVDSINAEVWTNFMTQRLAKRSIDEGLAIVKFFYRSGV